MAIPIATKLQYSSYHFTKLFYLLLLVISPTQTTSLNIINILSSYPGLSTFTSLLSSTEVSLDLTRRSSLTILAISNSHISNTSPPSPDSLRFHILLQYLTLQDFHQFPPPGKLITTLFQTTGRATNNYGSLNVMCYKNSVTFRSPFSSASLISVVISIPYNLSILTVDSVLIPLTSDLRASETHPSLNSNITETLIGEGHSFHVAASMLSASGLASEFERDEGGAGLTLFVPTDEAFANLPTSINFQSLPADMKAEVLKFHVLRSYYPLGSLESIVNPVQPTLATEEMGAGRFTLNISKINGSVAINTGIDEAMVTQTVFDQNPVAIFGVSKVLLPREIFGDNPIVEKKPDVNVEAPDYSPAPNFNGPVGSPEEIRSWGGKGKCAGRFVTLLCISLFVFV